MRQRTRTATDSRTQGGWRDAGWCRSISVLMLMQVSITAVVLSAQVVVPKPVFPADFSSPGALQLRDIKSVQACHAVVSMVMDSIRQYWQEDTMYVDETRVTPPVVTQVANQCLTMFPIAALDTLELPTAMEIALLTGDTVPVNSVLTRLVMLRTSARDRAVILHQGLDGIKTRFNPVSIPFMQSLVTQLDSLGTNALQEQALGRWYIYDSYRRRGTRPDSLLGMARQVFASFQQLLNDKNTASKASKLAPLADALHNDIAWYTYLSDGTPALFQTWVEQVMKSATSGQRIGRLPPAIEGEFWIHREDTLSQPNTPTRGPVPFPGHVTLVFGVRDESQSNNKVETKQRYELLRRIHQRFPSIPLILLAETTGAVWNKIRVDDPATEAALLAQFYLDSLKIPAWLNVSKTVIDTTIRDAGGRPAIFASKTFEAWDFGSPISNAYVLDDRGYIVHQFSIARMDPEELFRLLEGLLRIRDRRAVP